jgi:hypothetical protein
MVLLRAIHGETLKLRRTLVLRLAFLGPLIVVGLVFLVFLDSGEQLWEDPPENAWLALGQMVNTFWALIVLPLFTTLQTALLAGIEHDSDQWNRLYVLPVPRWCVYVAKQAVAVGMMGLGHVVLAVASLGAGLLLCGLLPGAGFHTPVPWGRFLLPVGVAYLGSWLILGIHTWIGQRWKGFAMASGVGIVLTVAGMAVVSSRWGSFYPWALPGVLVNTLNKGESLPWRELVFGFGGGLLATAVGAWEVTRRDVL